MSNVLSEEKKQQVIALGRLGWPLRRIEQVTGVRRETAGQPQFCSFDGFVAQSAVGRLNTISTKKHFICVPGFGLSFETKLGPATLLTSLKVRPPSE